MHCTGDLATFDSSRTHELCDDILFNSYPCFVAFKGGCWRYTGQNRHCYPMIFCFPVSVHGCQLKENMDITGGSVQVTYVKTTEECAKICSQTKSCDSFWCYTHGPPIVSGGVTKSCHLKRNGKYRKADHKTAGICLKGRFSYFQIP